MPTSSQPDRVAMVTVVSSTGCHFCQDAQVALADLSQQYPLDVRYLDVTDPTGRDLAARHRAAMFPLVLVDGQFFSQGRLPRGKLRLLLDTRDPVGAR